MEAATLKRQLLAPRDAEIDITVTAESITVSWNNPPSEVENYVINIIPAGPNQERTLNVRNISETTFSNLDANANYTITVLASDE
ncbi:MAG: fibronectin type III domain-containing protein [Candidatus Oxydemutatoraceae bacterium WSBS_2016_MAG_OTU14]